jgi:exodeoxyribonuclease VII large subunit
MTTPDQISFLDAPRPDGSSPDRAIAVATLTQTTQRIIEDRIPRLWVRGEIANWKVHRSGHRYFSLRDDTAQVDCVMFQGDSWRLPADPENGMEVAAFGQATLFAARGRFQLIVRSLEASGEGLWRIAFDRLRRELESEGLLDPSRRRRLPPFPRRIGIITSRSGAALTDVLTVLRRRSPWVDIVVHDCRVQGEGAALDIRTAIARVSSVEGLDVIILTRGGGSMEDLWCFNEEVAVRAVAECPVPIVCAIGHEVDVTLSELAADLRAPTPSVAAELATPDRDAVAARLEAIAEDLERGLRRRVDRGRQRVVVIERGLPRSIQSRLERARARAAHVAGRLDALSPLGTLARGYAVATSGGRLLSSMSHFRDVGEFELRVLDGRVRARVEGLEPDGR